MKTDNDYIYPETAEELAMFYGWECELNYVEKHRKWKEGGQIVHYDILNLESGTYDVRLPLPTISDLKVGDVVREDELTALYYILDEDATEDLEGWQLLIGRNTWVPIKVT
jgi:RNA polymerase-interacting CarD/CdnL/TRCF family regulator